MKHIEYVYIKISVTCLVNGLDWFVGILVVGKIKTILFPP